MSVTTYEKSFCASFSVDDKFFKRLEGLAPNPLKATVELSDGATIDQLSISDLLDLPNPRSRQILRVNVTTSNYLARPKLEVSLGRVFAPISYSITGDDKTASYLSTQLDRLLRDHVNWYSWINHIGTSNNSWFWRFCLS